MRSKVCAYLPIIFHESFLAQNCMTNILRSLADAKTASLIFWQRMLRKFLFPTKHIMGRILMYHSRANSEKSNNAQWKRFESTRGYCCLKQALVFLGFKSTKNQYSVNFYAASASKLNISLILSLFNVVFGFFSNTSIIRCT